MQMNPAPRAPVPIFGGGVSAEAIARAAQLCEGWVCASAHDVDETRHYAQLMNAALRGGGSRQ
jgi:alkanesulfonate monooxygenase SsuD/methylene tetrahydromethanopterin reductase-like flavin-dependent oxidoreductase (luciferase family)